MTNSRRRGYRRAALYIILMLAAFFAGLVMLVPTLDVNKRQRVNEASAVGKIKTILALERSYAALHPEIGYACELSQLESAAAGRDGNPVTFPQLNERLGYKYALVACHGDSDDKVLHFTVTAVPIKSGDAGFEYRAFCANESGPVRYAKDGSSGTCISAGSLLGSFD